MKLAVFSDTHGFPDKMLSAIELSSPDVIVHLGDGELDVNEIKRQFPAIPLKSVRGNCDLHSKTPETEFFLIYNIKVFITHGHLFGVKRETSSLIEKAYTMGADIVMYGHTHIANCSRAGNLIIINPGSCGYTSSSYAEVIISDSGEIISRIIKF